MPIVAGCYSEECEIWDTLGWSSERTGGFAVKRMCWGFFCVCVGEGSPTKMSPTDAKDSSMANNNVIESIRGKNTCSKRYERDILSVQTICFSCRVVFHFHRRKKSQRTQLDLNTSTQSINLHFEFVCIISNFFRHCPVGNTNNSIYHMKLKRWKTFSVFRWKSNYFDRIFKEK